MPSPSPAIRSPLAAAALLLAVLPLAARGADEPAYLDDRSTAEQLVLSFYNAVDRGEYARAWSYYDAGQGVDAFPDFAEGYASTTAVTVTLGTVASEGAAGSTYFTVPVALDAVDRKGVHAYFAGCYVARLANPQVQAEPPFHPMHLVSGKLHKVTEANLAPPGSCPP